MCNGCFASDLNDPTAPAIPERSGAPRPEDSMMHASEKLHGARELFHEVLERLLANDTQQAIVAEPELT